MRNLVPTRTNLSYAMFDEFNKIFDEFFKPNSNIMSQGKVYMPKLNAYKKDGKYCVDFTVPYATKEDIDVEVTPDKVLVVTVKSHQETINDEDYIIREISRGACMRRIQLGEDVDTESIKAIFEDGMLKVEFVSRTIEPVVKKIAIA